MNEFFEDVPDFRNDDFSELERRAMHAETMHVLYGKSPRVLIVDDVEPKLAKEIKEAIRHEEIMLIRGKQLCGVPLSMVEQFILYDHEVGYNSFRETPAPPQIKSYWDGHSSDSNIKKKLPYYFNKRRF